MRLDPRASPERIGHRCWRIALPDPYPPGVTSVFVLGAEGEERWLLDAGADTEESVAALRDGLRGVGSEIRPETATVVLSHSHLDHTGGLLRWRPARLVAHDRCAREMANRNPVSSRGFEALRRMGVPEEALSELAGSGVAATASPLAGIPVDVSLAGTRGDLSGPAGWSWILAEGHAPGHLMIYEPGERVLLAGDQFLVRWKTPYRVADPDEDAFGLYLASLDAAIGLEPDVVCSSHTRAVRPALPWLRDRRDALRRQAARTREAAAAGPVSAWELVPSRPGPPGLRVLLLREQLAILRHLSAIGELVRRHDGAVERFEPA